jgi:hypothetical protein
VAEIERRERGERGVRREGKPKTQVKNRTWGTRREEREEGFLSSRTPFGMTGVCDGMARDSIGWSCAAISPLRNGIRRRCSGRDHTEGGRAKGVALGSLRLRSGPAG